jgi:hypothetical protein
MKWPLLGPAVPDRRLPYLNRLYLHAPAGVQNDPTMVWDTEIDADALRAFLREQNRDGRAALITVAHALIRATALALAEFPEMNVRLVGRRIYAFRDINIRLPLVHRRNGDIDLLIIQGANSKSLEQIAKEVWQRLLQAARGQGNRERYLTTARRIPGFWLRQILRLYFFLDRHFPLPTTGSLDSVRAAAASVNDLSFPGAPPMRSYKPTRFPDPSDSLRLTLGPAENKVVARGDHFASVTIMPLSVRADHRLVDAHQLGRFVAAVRNLMNHPERLALPAVPPVADTHAPAAQANDNGAAARAP